MTRAGSAPARRDVAILTLILAGCTLLTVHAAADRGALRLDAPLIQASCAADEPPAFVFGFKELADHVGPAMGEPVECEHGDDRSADTFQRTTTGIARFDPCLNVAMFTRGDEHWALTPDGLVRWTGPRGAIPAALPTVHGADLRRPCAHW